MRSNSVSTIDVRLLDVLARLGMADFVKMNMEGGEWAIITDRRFQESPPKVVALEYHSHLCPGGDARAAAEAAMREAGLHISHRFWYGSQGYGMLWAWRSGEP